MPKKMISKTEALKIIRSAENDWRLSRRLKAKRSESWYFSAGGLAALAQIKRNLAALGLLLLAALLLCGCSSLRQLGVSLRPGVAITDQRFEGVAGAFVSPTTTIAELRAGTAGGFAANLLTGGIANDPLGFLLPITLPGQLSPAVYAICSPGKWATRCAEVAKVNQPIVAYGQQLPGLPFLVLSRLVKE